MKFSPSFSARTVLRTMAIVLMVASLSACEVISFVKLRVDNARADHVWASDSEVIRVPFHLLNDHIMVPVTLDSGETLQFVLDTGADMMIVTDSHRSHKLALPRENKISVSGSGPETDSYAYIVEDIDIKIGELTLQAFSMIHLPIESTGLFNHRDEIYFDGVIGYDFIQRFPIMINYDAMELNIYKPGSAILKNTVADKSWHQWTMDLDGTMPYANVTVTALSGKRTEAKLLVDTGSTGSMTLMTGKEKGISLPNKTYKRFSKGVDGEFVQHIGMAKSVELSDLSLQNLAIGHESSENESDLSGNGVLGNKILSRFNMVVDYEKKQLFIQRNQRGMTDMGGDRSGLQVLPTENGALVLRVAEKSAAASQGLVKGDVITEFSGKKLKLNNFDEFKSTLYSNQQAVQLCWDHEQKQQCGEMTLQTRL